MAQRSYRILSRRDFFATTAGSLVATSPLASDHCRVTPPNIEGPYWRVNAPFTTDLRGSIRGGEALVVSGRVASASACAPVAGAVLDVWHADHEGYYDLDRPGHDRPETWYLRGRIRTGSDGNYRFETIKPASYGMGGSMRPAHIHFKIAAAGHRRLTTQLYFEGDPHLDSDPLRAVRPELVRTLTRMASGVLACRFDITLRPV